MQVRWWLKGILMSLRGPIYIKLHPPWGSQVPGQSDRAEYLSCFQRGCTICL